MYPKGYYPNTGMVVFQDVSQQIQSQTPICSQYNFPQSITQFVM